MAKENRLLAKHRVRVAWKEASMRRRYELIYMVVVMGFRTTIAAAGLLFLAANGTISISPAENLAEEDGQVIMGLVVGATQASTRSSASAQERLGSAIMQLATVQLTYDGTHTVIQEHLAEATASATRTKL